MEEGQFAEPTIPPPSINSNSPSSSIPPGKLSLYNNEKFNLKDIGEKDRADLVLKGKKKIEKLKQVVETVLFHSDSTNKYGNLEIAKFGNFESDCCLIWKFTSCKLEVAEDLIIRFATNLLNEAVTCRFLVIVKWRASCL